MFEGSISATVKEERRTDGDWGECCRWTARLRFKMKPLKNENEVGSTMKSTTKYAFVAPGAIAKGRGKGLKSLSSLRMSRATIPFSSSTDPVIMQYNQIAETKKGQRQKQGIKSMSTVQETRTMNKNLLVIGHMQTSIPSFSFTEEVVKYIQTVGNVDLQKERGISDMCSFEDAENYEGSFHQNARHTSQSMIRPSNSTKSHSTKSAAQELRTMNKRTLVHEEECKPIFQFILLLINLCSPLKQLGEVADVEASRGQQVQAFG